MKRILLLTGLLIFTVIMAQAQRQRDLIIKKVDPNKIIKRTNNSILTFDHTDHDFKMVYQGDTVYHNFKLTNTGTENMVLYSVLTSCGCTATHFPRNPIKPGESDYVVVAFRSEGKIGGQHNKITVNSNASNGPQILNIRSNVVRKYQKQENK